MIWYLLSGLLGLAVLLLLICLIRTLLLKPTPAVDAKIDYADDERARQLGEGLAELIRCETVSSRFSDDKTKFYAFHKVLEKNFSNIFKTCEKHDFSGSLLFKWSGRKSEEPILLMSHQDVVEAGGEWLHEPFAGEVTDDGRVWGRGTIDTKGSLFSILTAVEELIAEGFVPEHDVYIASSCTEETNGDGAPDTAKYLKDNGIKLAMLIDEGGLILDAPLASVKGMYAMVGILEKGYGDIRFTAKSQGGHASAPGKNTPLARLAAFICDMEKNNHFTPRFNPAAEEMFRRFAPNMSFPMRFLFSNLWLFKPLMTVLIPKLSSAGAAMLRTTMAFTTAKGSDGLNVLPQEAYVTGNMRFIPHQGTDESIGIVSRTAEKYGIETEVIHKDYPCPLVDHNGEAFRKVEQIIEDIFPGVGVFPYTMTVGTDAKYYREVCDNCLRFAPLYVDKQQYASIHGLNENLYCKTLPKAVEFYKEVIRRS